MINFMSLNNSDLDKMRATLAKRAELNIKQDRIVKLKALYILKNYFKKLF